MPQLIFVIAGYLQLGHIELARAGALLEDEAKAGDSVDERGRVHTPVPVHVERPTGTGKLHKAMTCLLGQLQ